MNLETLNTIQNVFVRIKGLYEGLYKGFYRNNEMEQQKYLGECLGPDSYEALNVIARAYDDITTHEDWTRELMGLTALVRVFLDNEKNCRFDKMAMDITTYCFVNDCSTMTLAGTFMTNWAEAVYAFNMIWTTIVSAEYGNFNFENAYNFYYIIGQNIALLADDFIGFRAKDEYDFSIDDDEFAE